MWECECLGGSTDVAARLTDANAATQKVLLEVLLPLGLIFPALRCLCVSGRVEVMMG